jgi:hypothetical protein
VAGTIDSLWRGNVALGWRVLAAVAPQCFALCSRRFLAFNDVQGSSTFFCGRHDVSLVHARGNVQDAIGNSSIQL